MTVKLEGDKKEEGGSTATLIILTPKHTCNTERIAFTNINNL